MAYLDHNATSPLRPEARASIQRASEIGGNASAIHRAGRMARSAVDQAREQVARLVNANPNEVVFTSGGSEANALALWGAVHGAAGSGVPVTRLVVSAIEHDSVLKTAAAIADRLSAIELVIIPVARDGIVDLGNLEERLGKKNGRTLIAVMSANNETGVIQPIQEVAALTCDADAILLVDAVQSCGKIAVDFATLGADFLSVSAHKFGGPQGAGALVVKADTPFAPQIPGGQEKGYRAGTENVAAIAGFGAAAACITRTDVPDGREVRDRFEAGLRRSFPDVVIFGDVASRLGNTSNFAIPQISSESAVIALDLDGVMVSSGAACSSGKVRHSHVLEAMGVPRDLASCGVRASFGWNSEEADGDAALAALERLAARIRRRKAA